MKMPEIEKHEALLIFLAWSLLIGCAAFVGGYKAASPDCGTCEAALDDAIDELHKCQQGSLTNLPNKCQSERQAERLNCQKALTQYKLLRCKICDVSNDTFTSEPPRTLDTSRN